MQRAETVSVRECQEWSVRLVLLHPVSSGSAARKHTAGCAFSVIPSNKCCFTLLGALRQCATEGSGPLPVFLADDCTVGQFSLST